MIYAMRHTEKNHHTPMRTNESYADFTERVMLTSEGIARAQRAAVFLSSQTNIRRIISSHFLRAKQTAEIIGEICNVPVEIDHRLGERILCNDKSTESQIKLYNQKSLSDWSWHAPGGESMDAVFERLNKVVTEINTLAIDGDTLIVSHSRSIQAYAGTMRNDATIDYASADPSVLIPYGLLLKISNDSVRKAYQID